MCEVCREYEVQARDFMADMEDWIQIQVNEGCEDDLMLPDGLARAAAVVGKSIWGKTDFQVDAELVVETVRIAFMAGVRQEKERSRVQVC